MHILRTINIGDEIKLGETTYRILDNVKDNKRKVIPGAFVAEPCAWTDLILDQPETLRKFTQKTEQITIVCPLIIWDYGEEINKR